MSYQYELLEVDVDEGVATVLLNRPPMNPMNIQLFSEIGSCARELSQDDEVRSVVITGGDGHFSAGDSPGGHPRSWGHPEVAPADRPGDGQGDDFFG